MGYVEESEINKLEQKIIETEKDAKTEFLKAVELDPGHLWASVSLDDLSKPSPK